jgi:hypothetical protein
VDGQVSGHREHGRADVAQLLPVTRAHTLTVPSAAAAGIRR